MYINERISNIVRIKDYEDRSSFLRLDMNENPKGLPEVFVERVLKKIDRQLIASYPNKLPLVSLIAGKEKVREENVAVTCGSDEAIRCIFEVFTQPGSRVLMVAPSFEMYRVYGEMFGVNMETVLYDEEFQLPSEEMKQRITKDVDVLVLFNPNSPIGASHSKEEFEEFVMLCEKTGTLVVVDEAYYPFGVSSMVDFVHKYPGLIVLRTFSKLCSMAGLRVGYAIGGEELIKCLDNSLPTYNVNTIGLLFAEELLKDSAVVQELLEKEDEGKKYLLQELACAEYETYTQGGNYILIRPKTVPTEVAAKLKEKRILIKTYRQGILKDWIRVTTANKETMEQFWKGFVESDV